MKGVFSKRSYDAQPLRKWHTKICSSEWIRIKFLSSKDNETIVWYRVGGKAKHENLASNKVITFKVSPSKDNETTTEFDSREFYTRERERRREVWYFIFIRPLAWKQPVSRSLRRIFYVFPWKKILGCGNNAVYGWQTWRRRHQNDFWWVRSTKLTCVNRVLLETIFPQNFVADERSATSFSPALHLMDY